MRKVPTLPPAFKGAMMYFGVSILAFKASNLPRGTLTLNGLQLDSGGTFMGAPSAAVIKLMKGKDDKITMKFVLDGKLNDPNFRLNEGFSTRLASSFGEAMGISVEGLAKGAGSLGQKSVEAAGGSAEGVGKAVKGLFGR